MSSTITQNLSQLVLQMSESATIKMAQMARDLAAEGHDVISLSLGEPDFDTPQHIKDAAIQALADGYTKYTPVPGLVELRKSIVTKFKRDNNLDFDISQIVVSNGAKQSIANLCLALLNKGDEVVILAPYWVSYSAIVKMVGATPIPVSGGIEKDFKVTGEQLKEAITENTKMVLFSSPCNPTGSVYTHDELKDLSGVISKHENITIVSDEIYEYINFTNKHVSIGTFENVKDRTVTVNGFAKGFAMTGWRLGYIGAPTWIAKACAKIQGQFTSGATAFGQMAGAHALSSDLTPTHKMKEAFQKRRDLVKSLLDEIPGIKTNNPQGAFYFFPDISSFFGKTDGKATINNSVEFCEYLLQNAHVAAVAGSAFGDNNCFRISYAASEAQLTEAMRRVKEALAKLS
ncbi:pyridoxal phosphate-dependent aminotransferase [bacterium]|nr:pyridoxal phosphate-dependent aminotransferase [Saprospiraceae bacterium]MDC3253507.1 pyridoxal phosphate-dependent aminotransferase [bacterium]